ncbi:MAG: hypothetical protein KME30_12965 [Iphinoe sp. HA4291-MV1]|nr:hypothetical protein [Iphinoe sp. HA4291-MV1]
MITCIFDAKPFTQTFSQAIGGAIMKNRKAFALFAICTLSALCIPDTLNSQRAQAEPVNYNYVNRTSCRKFAGTYLITVTTNGNFASRSIVTLTQDGNIFVVDSSQGGVSGQFNPFGDAQGAWKCTSNEEITATTLNFGYPGTEGSTGNLARQDFRLTFEPQAKTVQGTIKLRSFDLQANPLEADGSDGGTFTFTGQRVTAE